VSACPVFGKRAHTRALREVVLDKLVQAPYPRISLRFPNEARQVVLSVGIEGLFICLSIERSVRRVDSVASSLLPFSFADHFAGPDSLPNRIPEGGFPAVGAAITGYLGIALKRIRELWHSGQGPRSSWDVYTVYCASMPYICIKCC